MITINTNSYVSVLEADTYLSKVFNRDEWFENTWTMFSFSRLNDNSFSVTDNIRNRQIFAENLGIQVTYENGNIVETSVTSVTWDNNTGTVTTNDAVILDTTETVKHDFKKEQLLRESFIQVNSLDYMGKKTDKEQLAAFPRNIQTIENYLPDNIKYGQIEQAYFLLMFKEMKENIENNYISGLEQVKAGKSNETFKYNNMIFSVSSFKYLKPYLNELCYYA